MLFKKDNKIVAFDDEKLANLLGFKEKIEYEEFNPSDVGTGVFNLKEKRELSPNEVNEITNKLESFMNNDVPTEYEIKTIKKLSEELGFVVSCDYRGGEKIKTILSKATEEPENLCCEWEEHCDLYECEAVAYRLWSILRELIQLDLGE